ncbi:MAG: 2,3-bisphosphoglycerate-independent phosphoglycerate mutase [Parcubacteria group bacterium]
MVKHPLLLIVLDGWGVAPSSEGNGITLAKTPNFSRYVASYPTMTLLASGESVGLSWGEVGNSEVGHLNLGVGKIFYQNLPRISRSIESGEFYNNKAMLEAMEHVKKNKTKLHLMGLVSNGRVHAMNEHCYALLEMAKRNKVKDVFVHAFLDGRDSKFDSGKQFVKELEDKMSEQGVGTIASVHGRMYAMDRDNRWERVEKSYRAIVDGKSEEYYKDANSAIEKSYEHKVYDEEFIPVVIGKADKPTAIVGNGDAVIFFNYRADRGRELTHAFTDDKFEKFARGSKFENLFFVTMTEYEEGLPVHVAYEREVIKTSLPKVLSEKGYRQLHIAETEKYAHVTFFFSGGHEEPYENEERIVIPSPKVSTYSETPEMSAKKITEALVKEILKEKFDFIVVNFANADMVGHTGDVKATIAAVECIDKCLGEIVDLILSKGGQAVITADHGNAEELVNLQTSERDKEHSTNTVPCIIIGKQFEGKAASDMPFANSDLSLLQPTGLLADVAPTVLKLMGVEIPKEMEGKPLI